MEDRIRPAALTSDAVTVLRTTGDHLAAKAITLTANGLDVADFSAGAVYTHHVHEVGGLADLVALLRELASDPRALVIRGGLGERRKPRRDGTLWRRKVSGAWRGYFADTPRHWLCVDVDKVPLGGLSQIDAPEAVVEFVLGLMGAPFDEADVFWQASASAGLPGQQSVKLHVWFWLDRPLDSKAVKATLMEVNRRAGMSVADIALADSIQAHYTAWPIMKGLPDPLPLRDGIRRGKYEVLPVAALPTPPVRPIKPRDDVPKPAPRKATPPAPMPPPRAAGGASSNRRRGLAAGGYALILEDIKRLARLRHGRQVAEGERNTFVFCAAIAAANVSVAGIEAEVRALAALLVPYETDEWIAARLSELMNRVRRHRAGEEVEYEGRSKSPIYAPSVAWFMARLGITDEEQEHMARLISPALRKRRLRTVRADRNAAQVEAILAVEAEFIAKGRRPTNAEIAARTGLSRSTVTRVMNAL